MKVSFGDINKRISRLGSPQSPSVMNMREARIYTNTATFCSSNATNSIKNWESLDENADTAFNIALDIFDEICANENDSTIRSMCSILCENVDKVRDQSQLANSLKYRFASMKRKPIVKVAKMHNDVSDKIKAALTIQPTKMASAGIAKVSQPQASSKSSEVADECYAELIEKNKLIIECDRILKNYSIISRRFNLDKIVSDISHDNDIYQTCFEIASYIDTYNQSFKNKYNSALETTVYLFDKHFLNYPKEKIVEAITDYFIFCGALKEDQINDVDEIKRISVMLEERDFSSIDWLTEPMTEPAIDQLKFDDDYGTLYGILSENDITKSLKKTIKDKKKELKKDKKEVKKIIKTAAKEGNPEEQKQEEIKNMVDDFKRDCMKNKDSKNNLISLKSLIIRIFSKSPYEITHELPSIFSLIRTVFILGSFTIHPVVGIVTLITNELLKIHYSRKQVEKIKKAYTDEIASTKTKIEKTKDDETKDKLQKYLDELKKDLEKIKQYENDLYTDDENDERMYSDTDYDDYDDDDFEFDDEDFGDLDFEEMAYIQCISDQMSTLSEALIYDTVDGIVCNNIFKFDNDSIDDITDFYITVPAILDKETLKEALISHRDTLRKSASNINDYIRIDCLNENILKLDKSPSSYNTATNAKDALYYLYCLNEIAKVKSNEYLVEMEFGNTIKLAINQLKKNAVKLSDKEKQLSNSIDVSANNVAKGMESALMTNNRESVIRGSIIPSASKCIKTAIIAGAAWAINPAVAVIGAIGAFACNRKLQKKERQLILDDIEIELKMCERYMRQAEDEGDMKKVRQIEIAQRNLQRQKQRITYKMVAVYNQPVVKADDND